jgi:hypothetical protein
VSNLPLVVGKLTEASKARRFEWIYWGIERNFQAELGKGVLWDTLGEWLK